MESLSQEDHSEPSQLDEGLPEVSSTPCFVVLDSQAEDTEHRGEESTTEARARRLKQLAELTKNPLTRPSLEMEYGGRVQCSGDKGSDKREGSTGVTTSKEELRAKQQPSKDEDEIPKEEEEEEEEEENEVISTQEDLFEEEKKLPTQQEDFRSPSTSKDASHILGTPSVDVHSTPTSKDASNITGTPSQEVHITPTSRDSSHLISTPSETVGSLRFSGIVLANETSTSGSSASINVVYPSPEAYGPAPIIIPSTPTRPDTSNEEPMDMSENEEVVTATLPQAPLKRKSTNTSDESEDVYRVPAWQQELNQLQKRKEAAANTQDSWLEDNTGSKQQRSLSTSIDSTNPSSEHSENIHKSSAELEESLSLQQQQPLMSSTTDESLRQSASSRPPSTSIVGNGTKDRVSNSAPILGETGAGRVSREAKHSLGSSLPEVMPSTAEHLPKEQSKELHTKDQLPESPKPLEIEMQSDEGTRLNVTMQGQEKGHEPDVEIIDDDDEEDVEDDGNKGDDVGVGVDVDPSQDWCLRLSPSQTQTQTQYSIANRDHGMKGLMSQRDLSQTKAKDVEEEVHQIGKTHELKGDGTTAVSRQATPWHSTQVDDAEDDDDVSIVIPESERLDENKENDRRSSQKLSNPDDEGEKERRDGSREKLSESGEGQGMEDSVFLEGEAQLPSDGKSRLGQLGESDNPSPIAGFHLSVPKDGALLRPLSSVTPHLGKKGQWMSDGTPRHSTPKADETELRNNQKENVSTPDTFQETPKTSSKSVSALVVSGVMEMDSAESSEIPAFNLRNPADDCSELLKEAKESPSKRQKSVFSRVREATTTAKSNPRTKKTTVPADKDPFSLTKPKSKFILGRKRNQQSLAQAAQPLGTSGVTEQSSKEQEVAHEEEKEEDVRQAPDVVAMEEEDDATIPLEYHHDDPNVEDPDVQVVEEQVVVEEGSNEKEEIIETRQEETQQYGTKEQHEAEVEMDIFAEEEKMEEGKKEEEGEERSSKEQVSISQGRRRDPYEFTESQSNKTPTPMKTWARTEDSVPVEKLPSRNLDEVSSFKPAAEQPSTSKITPKTKRTPKGSRQTRGGKRKRPQEQETTEEDVETPALNRTRTSPRKSTATVRKAPKKRGKVLEKQQSKSQVVAAQTERPPHIVSPSLTERVVEDQMPVALERRLPQTSPSSLELRQIPSLSPPTRQPDPWKIVRYKKVNITQRIKEVFEWGKLVETTVVGQVINDEIIEKIEHEFMTPSPRSLTSGSLADISSLGSRTSSSTAGSLQKSSSVLSTGMQKSISLSGISEVNSSLDKTISLPGSEKTSPNISVHEHSASGRKLTSPGGVFPQRIPSRGARASPSVLRRQDSSSDTVQVSPGVLQPNLAGASPWGSRRKSSTGGIQHQPDHSEQKSRTSGLKSPGVSPSALMISGKKQGGQRTSSKGSNSSSVSSSDAEGKRVFDEKDSEFTKPFRTPSRRAVQRTPEQAEQSMQGQSSNIRLDAPPPINLSGGWNVEELQQSSEDSEGIPCAQPRKETDRVSSDEAVGKSDGDVGRQTTTTEESLERVDEAGPSSRNLEGSSTRPTRGKRRGKTPTKQTLDDTQMVHEEGGGGDIDLILTEPPEESRQKAGNTSSTSELTTDSAQAFLVPGVRVFTRWMDGFYYPGTIKAEEKNNKLKIAFDDGDVRNVNTKDIIIKDWLSFGQSVMAESSTDGYNYPGIVIGYYRGSNPKDAGYYIETDNGHTARYLRQKVILSKDQATLLLTSCPSSSTGISDVSLENLVEGPRQRSRLRAPSGEEVVRTPSKVLGRTPRRVPSPAITRSGGKRKAVEKQPEDSDVSPRKKTKQLATRLLATVAASPDLSKQGIGLRRSPRKQPPHTSTSSSPARDLTPPTPRTMEMLLGPLPINRALFKGMAFFLTQGDVKNRSKVSMDTSTSESEMDDDHGADEVPFDKDYTRKQIEAGGGIVLKDLNKSQRTQYKLFLIANTYCRTKKYFLALAFNMRCISNLWIRDCSRTDKLQSHKAYQLPAGETLDGDVVEWKPNRCILSGLKIFVMSTHYEVESTWRSILMAAGCYMVVKFPTINELNRGGVPFDCNVLVTDPTCPRHILHRAQQLDIPVVSVEWVMQSLINGIRMPYESHYKFSWDYKEKQK